MLSLRHFQDIKHNSNTNIESDIKWYTDFMDERSCFGEMHAEVFRGEVL